MKFAKPILFFIIVIIIIAASACSSSSYSERYSKPKEEHKTNSKNVRFSSDNDKPPSDADNSTASNNENANNTEITVYNDLPDNPSEFDEPPPAGADENLDTKKFVENYEKLKSFNVALTPREKVLFEVIKFIDTPYKYGGSTNNGIDCSAFTKEIFETSLSVELPRTAREQYKTGEKINSKDELQFGDLVFFNTTKRSFPGHVGIYLGEGKFVHASRSLGVTVSHLDNPYYKSRYVGARRINNYFEQ